MSETKEVAGLVDGWLLVKRGLYWRPDAQGYTGLKEEAGIYSDERSAAYRDHDDEEVTIRIRVSEADDIAPGASDEVRARYWKSRAEAKAREIERLTAERDAAALKAKIEHQLFLVEADKHSEWLENCMRQQRRAETAEATVSTLTADCQMKDELLTAAVDDYNQALATVSTLTAERDEHANQLDSVTFDRDRQREISAELLSTVSTLTRQLEEAREALEPFAKAGEVKLCGNFRDDERCAMTDAAAHLTFGDLRRAAAIRSLKQGPDNDGR